MKMMLLVPALLLAAACGDNLDPEQTDDQSASCTDDHCDGGGETPAREIDGAIYIETITCNEAIARYEADARYVDDGSPVFGLECLWTFDDGTTSTQCAGEHPFADDGFHDFVLEVRDPATGASDRITQRRFFQPPLEITLDVTGDDLSLTWNASSSTGGEQIVRVEPADLVIAEDPDYMRRLHYTVQVRRAGTYTVTYDVEDERSTGEICNATISKEITLVCDGAGHVH